MDLNTGLYTYQFLCEDAGKFIYIVPSFRGEKLVVNGHEYLSEGDRTDGWDGATDDAISLLNAALGLFNQVDTNRIAAFGKSRGGSLSLLMGIRDKRIKLVLDWAGPMDWFKLMGLQGFTQHQLAEMGLINRSTTFQVGGQFIERFLLKNINGKEGIVQARKKMIASSPLYFYSHLENVQAHYGVEDNAVPIINGEVLKKVLASNKPSAMNEIFIHKNAGHDLDEKILFPESKKYLSKLLEEK